MLLALIFRAPLFPVVDFAVLRRKGREKERKKREGKERGKRTFQRAFFGGCVLLLVGFWVRRGARDVKKKIGAPARHVSRGERVVPVSEEVGWVIVCLFLPASVFSVFSA